MNAVRVLIADCHDVVRRGLKEILMDAFPGTIFCESGNGDETLMQMVEIHFDLMLLDINTPEHNGFKVLHEAKLMHPDVPIIVVSVHSEEQYGKHCMQAGAAAYIRKDRASDELAQVVKAILSA